MTVAKAPLPGSPWLRLARWLALVFMLLSVAAFIAGVFYSPGYAARHPGEFAAYTWTPDEMNQIVSRYGIPFDWLGYNLITAIIAAACFCLVGAIIFFRKKDDWFGLFVSVMFVLYGTLSSYPVTALAGIHPAFKPVLTPLGVIVWPMFFLMFYLFPDGHFVPRWTRWAGLGLVVVFAIVLFVYRGNQPPTPYLIAIMALVLVGMGSQVYRYRRHSDIVQRQQIKWVVLTILILVAVLLITLLPAGYPAARRPASPFALLLILTSSVSSLIVSLLPLSIGFAILRYRLWDVDLIIRRTLVYGALTATLALVYFGVVVVLQEFFQAITGQHQSPVATVISTLMIAALFTPLRRGIQRDIDRRFYRRKYDAQKTLESFAARARDEVDLDQLTANLIDVVQEAMQPEQVSLWIRKETRIIDEL
jgi:hypothetical protein